jgi:hypothetical protein
MKVKGTVSGWMRLSALRLPPLERFVHFLTNLGRHAPRAGEMLSWAKARRTCRRKNGRRGMMPPARSSRESIATCSSFGAGADISRAGAPGRCTGNQGVCLESCWYSVPYEAGIAAQIRMAAETPPNADRFTRQAHNYPPCSLCLHNPKIRRAALRLGARRRS